MDSHTLAKWFIVADQYRGNNPIVSTRQHIEYCIEIWKRLLDKHPEDEGYAERIVNPRLRLWYDMDLKEFLKETVAHKELANDIKKLKKGIGEKSKFVTIGFNDKTVNIDQIKMAIKKLNEMTSDKGFTVEKLVAEKFRKDDNKKIYVHHHIHLKLNTDLSRSKIIQFIYQKLKKLSVDAESFIDVKPFSDFHTKYLNGEKVAEKMECVEMDKKWRAENLI